MHSGAELKNYHHVFAFRAPPAGAGTITFKGLMKSGAANTGAWWWPNRDGPLKLTESTAPEANAWVEDADPVNEWVKGLPGASCDETCKVHGGTCDSTQLQKINSAEAFLDGPSKTNVCKLPIVQSCGNPSQSVDDEFCQYHSPDCSSTQAQGCKQKDPTLSFFCPCSAAVSVKPPAPPAVADECDGYCSKKVNPCSWTQTWSCPSSSKKGGSGTAANNGGLEFKCCCELNTKQDGCGADDADVYSLSTEDDDTWTEVVEVNTPVCSTLGDEAACTSAGCVYYEQDGMVGCDVKPAQERDMGVDLDRTNPRTGGVTSGA